MTYLYSARVRKVWLQHVNTSGVLKAGAAGASAHGLDGVGRIGSPGNLLLEVASLSFSATAAASDLEACTVPEPIF